jgi:hypothetical protein
MGATKHVVDFSNVKEQGNFNTKRIPAGDYAAKITKIEDAETKETKEFQYLFTFKPLSHSQTALPYYCKLQENQLWKLRNVLTACGINVPKKRANVDPNRCLNKVVGITVEDDEYDGKAKSVIAAVFPASELEDGGVSADADEPEEEPEEDQDIDADVADADVEEEVELEEEGEEEPEADEFDAMDRNALKVFIKGKDAASQFRKSETDDDLRTRARAFSAGDEEEEDLEELDISDL